MYFVFFYLGICENRLNVSFGSACDSMDSFASLRNPSNCVRSIMISLSFFVNIIFNSRNSSASSQAR